MTRDTDEKPRGESAYAQVSLYQPTLRFAISCSQPLSSDSWQQIWKIWEAAIAAGLGSKVSTGYGQITKTSHPIVYRAKLKGQGQAAKRIDGTGEFRPNIFRSALRGHALRIFGGLTDSKTAEELVQNLFGGIQQREATVGLLGFQFHASKLEIKSLGSGKYAQPACEVEGELIWFLAKPLSDPEQESLLKKLVGKLMQFAMVVGGFGKSWRRVDHRKFFEEYYENNYKPLIGCHWQWLGENTQSRNVQVSRLEKVGEFLEIVRQIAREWIQSQNKPLRQTEWAKDWREAWHPSNVQVWGRIADNSDESAAVRWFHEPYQQKIPGIQREGSIYQSSVTGKIGQISLIWHRLYPLIVVKNNPENPRKPIIKPTPRYLELIALFPDGSRESNDFLDFLNAKPDGFKLLWGGEEE